jgi:glycosyltransferase involved in cell wall biosynthesis
VKPYVADFDVAVVPSVYADPLPRAVIEGMALGKPVVAFASGGIPELIEEGRTGSLVTAEPPDLEGLARAILLYVRDAELRRRHGAAAREHARAKLDARTHAVTIQQELVAAAARA